MTMVDEMDDPGVERVDARERTASSRPADGAGRAVGVMVVVGALMTLVIGLVFAGSADGPGRPVRIDVPAGSGAAMYSGEDPRALIPPLIRLKPGQQLILENDDTRPHTLGPLTAEAGQIQRTTFGSEGRYIVATSLRPDGRVTILVERPGGPRTNR